MKCIILSILLLSGVSGSFAQPNVWRWQNPLPQGNSMHAVQMVNSRIIYACGENGTFIKTTADGFIWELESNILGLTHTFNAISFLDSNYGMIRGDSGYILKTVDG